MHNIKFVIYGAALGLLMLSGRGAYAEEKPMVVIIPSYNNAQWYVRNLDSVFSQNYNNFRIIYVADCWDKDQELLQEYKDKHDTDNRMILICNSERRGAMANVHDAVHACKDHEIVVMLDGDDWFAHRDVLSVVNRAYEDQNVWLTYGQTLADPNKESYVCRPIPNDVIWKNGYRARRWDIYPLRTFYAWLFKRIKQEDFMYEGRYLAMTQDLAFMFPMLEMSGGRFKMINEILYIYNRMNPISDDKVNRALQLKLDKYVRSLPRYAPLAPALINTLRFNRLDRLANRV